MFQDFILLHFQYYVFKHVTWCLFHHDLLLFLLDILLAENVYWLLAMFIHYEGIHFDIFAVEYNRIEIKKFLGNKNIKANIFRIQPFD